MVYRHAYYSSSVRSESKGGGNKFCKLSILHDSDNYLRRIMFMAKVSVSGCLI